MPEHDPHYPAPVPSETSTRPDAPSWPSGVALSEPAGPAPVVGSGGVVGPDWHDICAAYEEAAEHLEICAGQAESESEKNAHRIVASRIRAAGNRVRPNVPDEPRR